MAFTPKILAHCEPKVTLRLHTARVRGRFIQSIQQECLDRFVVFGSGHMDQICKEYLEHYHSERPHQGIENELVVKGTRGPLVEAISLSEVRSTERLGGLLRSYWRRAG